MLSDSPVCDFRFLGRGWLLKRDDLLDPELNGNKARKLYTFAANGFGADTVISYGGAQSNAMYSLSALAKKQNVRFVYYTKKLPETLRQNPSGNLAAALENGMKLVELEHKAYDETISNLLNNQPEGAILIRQGGADEYAKEGVRMLADELNEYAKSHALKNPIAVLSAGTGTTAGYLSEYLDFECVCVPAVSDALFLRREFERLGVKKIPTILEGAEKIPFASPHKRLIEIYKELLDGGVEFDLIYDAKCWLTISENMEFFRGRDTIFVHSGGTLGNKTQLERYRYKGWS